MKICIVAVCGICLVNYTQLLPERGLLLLKKINIVISPFMRAQLCVTGFAHYQRRKKEDGGFNTENKKHKT